MDESTITSLIERLIALSRRITEPLKPEWEARREVAKTVISLASASLVFTITFSPSLIKPNAPAFWRYSLVVCWLAFISSLVSSLGSLWFSMSLASLPFMVMTKTSKFKNASKKADQTSNVELVVNVFEKAFLEVARGEKIAIWLLRTSVTCFGAALLILTIIGVRQLVF